MPDPPRAFGYDVAQSKAFVLCDGGEKLYSDEFTQDSETLMVTAHWLQHNVSWVVPTLATLPAVTKARAKAKAAKGKGKGKAKAAPKAT
eukprot:9618132-Lingulodinium_polyedra.AAC.1